jgi:predicted nucleotidyltransferase
MLIDQIRAKKSAIDQLGVKYGARRICVFGSVASRRRADPIVMSIFWWISIGATICLPSVLFALAGQLESLLGRPVEVIPEHELNRHMR